MSDPQQDARPARIERSAAAAWPAGRTETAAGWLLRHTPGVARRRSNSALPPAPDRHPEDGLDAVEAFYRAAGLPVTVQVSPAEQHSALDAALAARGYRREAPTLVLTASTTDVITATPQTIRDRRAMSATPGSAAAGPSPAPTTAAGSASSAAQPSVDVVVHPAASADWLAAHQELNGPEDTSAVAELVLARVPSPAAFVLVRVDGRDAAIGMFVADGERAGVFCMATRKEYRRRGLALTVLGAGARWAAARDCRSLYLQVEEGTVAARELYSRVGFAHSHRYHYRVR
ncbi:GNAT family N-acetyltransferase [Actinoplanes sp. NPDC048967]|uniref:GNAT family N-acetyltransferase n=1 Tax=Actinoplanes sp. NPDC048967 TaxID=3155269 RepID=UPI0033C62921